MAQTLVQPDISYYPDFAKYQARTERRLRSETIDKTLPAGFPQKLESNLVWEGQDFKHTEEGKEEWIYRFSDEQLHEIDVALAYFKALKLPLGYIKPSTFPLPTLHPILRSISHDIHSGRGFVVLRGLRVDDYTRVDNIIIYSGVSSHIGTDRGRQDDNLNGQPADVVLTHIINLTDTSSKDNVGGPENTADGQVYHTDSGNIVSLLSLEEAVEGGESLLASSWKIYNELAETRPDLVRTLAEDWVVDGFGNPHRPYFKRPVLFHQPAVNNSPERIIIQCSRRFFTGFGALPRSSNIPPITEAQAEALDALHFLAEKYHICLEMKKGDVQYINNLSILHSRKGYTDSVLKKRHLLRFWFKDPENAWETPGPLQTRWNSSFQGVTEADQAFPLEPTIRGAAMVNRGRVEPRDDALRNR